MCAVFGFLDYGKMVSAKTLKRLLQALSVAAECRGRDATGMSYVKRGKIVTFKKAKPAHKVKLYFPRGTTAVIGHTRFTTQGSEKHNYNNHPFEGKAGGHSFALAHNGVLYNDVKLRWEQGLPETKIETDSYIAVQLLEQQDAVDEESLRYMAEAVAGNFVFTVLRDDNTLFLIKGDNPLVIWHSPALGLYLYASTRNILVEAVKAVGFYHHCEEHLPYDGNIVKICANGEMSVSAFSYTEPNFFPLYHHATAVKTDPEADYYEDLLMLCGCYGLDSEDEEMLMDWGYDIDDIEEMLVDHKYRDAVLEEAKMLHEQ